MNSVPCHTLLFTNYFLRELLLSPDVFELPPFDAGTDELLLLVAVLLPEGLEDPAVLALPGDGADLDTVLLPEGALRSTFTD